MGATDGQANTVLVIEDQNEVRRALARMLKVEGFDVLEARDGSEAVHLYAAHAARIVAATLDLMMPTTNGRETLAMLSEFAPRLPIVVSTALPLPDNLIGRVPGSRGVGYLQKPYTAKQLSDELRRVIAEESAGG
ncbi:MAG TPA: response regulator [Gemmatimonadaceae bacterium]|nr:response regulator [Gemmatimonadaceae bacterium]